MKGRVQTASFGTVHENSVYFLKRCSWNWKRRHQWWCTWLWAAPLVFHLRISQTQSCDYQISRLQTKVSFLVAAFALTVLASSQRQSDLTPHQATSGIKITLTSLVSSCGTHLVGMMWHFPSHKFSEFPLGSTSGSKSMTLCELRNWHTGGVNSTDCPRVG